MTKLELPRDVDECHGIILQMHERMSRTEQHVSQLVRSQYGRKSETVSSDQLRLFDVAQSAVHAHDLEAHVHQALRQQRAAPVLKQIESWQDSRKLRALPKSPRGKVVTYALNNWHGLCTYFESRYLTIDNNKSERTLPAMAVERKD